jgi:hypothetical protein
MQLCWVAVLVVVAALRASLDGEIATEVRAVGMEHAVGLEPSTNAKQEHHLTCKQLGIAYLLSLPIPCPPPGVSVVPAIALVVCCPDVIGQKLIEKGGQSIRFFNSLSKSRARRSTERLLAEVIPKEQLTDEQMERDLLDVQRQEIATIDHSLVKEHGLRNPSGPYQRLEAYVRKNIGKYSQARFNRTRYAENMDTLALVEQAFPWVLFPRLVQAYDDKRLTPEERESFIALMARLKEDNPWLPAVKDATLPRALQYDEDAGVVEEYLQVQDTALKMGLENNLAPDAEKEREAWAIAKASAEFLNEKRGAVCQMIGRLTTRAVTKMQKWMTGRATKFQLQDLRQRVHDLAGLHREIASPDLADIADVAAWSQRAHREEGTLAAGAVREGAACRLSKAPLAVLHS